MSEDTASKVEIVNILKKEYGSVQLLNKAWNTTFEDFDKIILTDSQIARLSDTALKDLALLRDVLIDKYSAVPGKYLSEIAPDALNLGMRYSSVDDNDFVGNDRFDVFSFNCYSGYPQNVFNKASKALEMPFIIGEWHIGSVQGGLMSGALVNAETQEERGKACAEYLRTAFTNTNCVGVHYFELNDQPLLGRFDGENMQIGLIDVCNRPYTECVERISAMNRDMYDILCGKIVPEKIEWKYHYRY